MPSWRMVQAEDVHALTHEVVHDLKHEGVHALVNDVHALMEDIYALMLEVVYDLMWDVHTPSCHARHHGRCAQPHA